MTSTSANKSTRKLYRLKNFKPKHEQTIMRLLCGWVVEHQIGIAVNLLVLLGLVHLCFPRARTTTRKFFQLQYYDEASGHYYRGKDDLYYVCLWFVIFVGSRAAIMSYVLQPIGRWAGITSSKRLTRFTEQGWLLTYDSFFWTLGMIILCNSSYWLNLQAMWTGFPLLTLERTTKWYYIVQFTFWLHQLFVIHIEERRNDHWQMFIHHLFTTSLILFSYGFYQTRVGNVILCLMDGNDILLPLAKMLNYAKFRTACDATFVVFLAVWLIARQILYPIVIYSVVVDLSLNVQEGCYSTTTGQRLSTDGGNAILANVMQPFNDARGPVCFNSNIKNTFLGLLIGLQVLIIVWFGMILKVVYGVIMGKAAEDTRSDEEEEEEAEEDVEAEDINELLENGVAQLPVVESGPSKVTTNTAGKATRMRRARAAARTSAISIPGHGDSKELLGRIGCDKPS